MNQYPPVSEIPFYDKGVKIPRKIKEQYGLINNAYRQAFARGLGGYRTESTWNKKMHTCCKSKVFWRHHGNCPRLGNREDPDDLSDLKDL